MTIAVIKLLGTNAERDMYRVLSTIPQAKPFVASTRDKMSAVADADGIIVPGGFYRRDLVDPKMTSYSNEIMTTIIEAANEGKPILGVAHGFQTLVEFGILPGELVTNISGRFVCRWAYLRVNRNTSVYTEDLEGAIIRLPIAHRAGRFKIRKTQLKKLNEANLVPVRYCDTDGSVTEDANPDGSVENIAGVLNEKGNVFGMMPYPERASRPLLSSTDGLVILRNFVKATKMS